MLRKGRVAAGEEIHTEQISSHGHAMPIAAGSTAAAAALRGTGFYAIRGKAAVTSGVGPGKA